MEITIRKAKSSDLDAIVLIQKQVQQLHIDALPEQYVSVSSGALHAWMASELDEPRSRVLLATMNSEVVGYAVVKFGATAPNLFRKSHSYAEIDQIAVHSAFRRRGVATELVNAVIALAKTEGCSEARLHVLEFNQEAQKFYEKSGFKTSQRRMSIEIDG